MTANPTGWWFKVNARGPVKTTAQRLYESESGVPGVKRLHDRSGSVVIDKMGLHALIGSTTFCSASKAEVETFINGYNTCAKHVREILGEAK